MTDEKSRMDGSLEGRSLAALAIMLSLTIALPDEVSAQAWGLESEKGVGGGGGTAPAAPAVPRHASQEKADDAKTRSTPPTALELLERAEPRSQPRRAILPSPPDPSPSAPRATIEVVAVPVILPSPPRPTQREESVQSVAETPASAVPASDDLAEVEQPLLREAALAADGLAPDIGKDETAATLSDNALPEDEEAISGSEAPVDIHVRFVEVSTSDVSNLGIDWGALVDSRGFRFGRSTGNVDDVGMEAFIDVLEREEIVDILAEPDVGQAPGEPATVLAGGEIPVLVPGEDGRATADIEEKPVGLSLEIMPTVLAGERIDLHLRPEVRSISSEAGLVLDGFAVPAFTVRQAETSVELANGQTVAIAGLFRDDLAPDIDAFPALADLPVLGQLFRSERFQRAETELVVLITPHLIEPAGTRDVAAQ